MRETQEATLPFATSSSPTWPSSLPLLRKPSPTSSPTSIASFGSSSNFTFLPLRFAADDGGVPRPLPSVSPSSSPSAFGVRVAFLRLRPPLAAALAFRAGGLALASSPPAAASLRSLVRRWEMALAVHSFAVSDLFSDVLYFDGGAPHHGNERVTYHHPSASRSPPHGHC